MTIGNGIGGEGNTATVSRGNAELKTRLTINKGGSATFGAFTISDNNGTPAALTMNGGSLTTGALTVNSGASITINDGSYILNADSGADSTNNGTITLTSGSFEITAGRSFRVGGNNANAKLSINGGTFTTPDSTPTYVATSTNGTIEQTAGTATFNGALILGWGNNSGTYNLSDGTLTTTGEAGLWNANSSGISTFNVTGGQANFNTFVIGLHNSSGDNALANVFNLNSGEVNTTGTFTVRKTGILNVSKTAQNAGGNGVLKANAIEINTSGVLNLSSGTINLGSGGITSSDNAYAINLSGGTLGTNNASWPSALNATLSNTTTFSPGEGQMITWSGVLSGSGSISKTGAGTLELSGTNTFTGGITVSAGKLLITGSSVGTGTTMNNNVLIEFAIESGTVSITNNVDNLTNGGKTIKTGAGTLSTDKWISGQVEVQEGTLKLTNGFGSGKRFNGTITIAQGATLDCAAKDTLGYGSANTVMNIYGTMNSSVDNETLNNTELHMYGGTAKATSGSTFDILNTGVKFYSYALTGATAEAPTVSTISPTLLLRHNGTLPIDTEANSQLNLTGEITGWYNNKTQYNCSITKSGEGTLVLSSRNPSLYGGTTISAGKVIANAAQSGSNAGKSVFGSGAVEVASGATLDFQVVNQLGYETPNDITIKGTLIPHNFTHVKNVTLQNGVIETENDKTSNGTGLDFDSRTATLASSGTSRIDSRININKNANVTINVTDTLTVNGVIREATGNNVGGGFTKAGAGTLNLTADNTYTGTTTISAGTIKLSGNGDLGSGEVVNNATLEFAHTDNKAFSNVISGTGAVNKTGSGTLTFSGANAYTGATTVSDGVLELTGAAVSANGPVSVGADGTLEYNVDGQPDPLRITADNKISGSGKVVKTGEGNLKLFADEGSIDVQSLTVSSGRVDIKEYLYGQLIVQGGATFSPGNSVGSLEIGDGANGSAGFILNEAGAELLMEIASSEAADNDVLIVDGDITLADGSVITLALTGNSLGLGESFIAILSAENSSTLDVLSHIQTSDFTDLDYVQITDGTYGTVYAITGRTLNANEIPEPSTWALLALGVCGLLYLRKRS